MMSLSRPRPAFYALAFFTLLTAAACGSDSSPSGVNVPFSTTDLTVGTGATAAAGNKLTVTYTGWLYDASKTDNKGTVFDSNATGFGPFTIGAGAVIAGWDQGIPGMKVGGTRRLVIPPNLAYGAAGSGPIPPNATLIFEVHLLAVQ